MSEIPESILRMFDRRLKGKDREQLFAAVAERIRTGLLTVDESRLVAGWFDRLANGEKPAKVLIGETRGQKRGATNPKFMEGEDVSLPDRVDLCWSLRQWIARTGEPERIFELCAKQFGRTPDYIGRLYKEISPTLADDPELK